MLNWKLLNDTKRYIELQPQRTDQARTYARYAMWKVQPEKFWWRMMKAWSDGAMLMNTENQRVETEERDPQPSNDTEHQCGRNTQREREREREREKERERERARERALKGMKCGKAVGADEIPAETWKCMGNVGIKIICKLYNCISPARSTHSAWIPTGTRRRTPCWHWDGRWVRYRRRCYSACEWCEWCACRGLRLNCKRTAQLPVDDRIVVVKAELSQCHKGRPHSIA